MRTYNPVISLTVNRRGATSLDPCIGCTSGMTANSGGCYYDCYAARLAKAYGYDFNKTVLRYFLNKKHIIDICNKIRKDKTPFIRMGASGDPSEDWEHTISICYDIFKNIRINQLNIFGEKKNKFIIIRTKHWNKLTISQLNMLSDFDLIINTSISALDTTAQINDRLAEYNRLKKYCKSVLRVVTCDFTDNDHGNYYKLIQDKLLSYPDVIETAFRPTMNNPFLKSGIINTEKRHFNTTKQTISLRSKMTHLGNCFNCPDQCGITQPYTP